MREDEDIVHLFNEVKAGLTSVISVLILYTSLLILYFLWLTSWSSGKVTGGHIVVKIFLLEEKNLLKHICKWNLEEKKTTQKKII